MEPSTRRVIPLGPAQPDGRPGWPLLVVDEGSAAPVTAIYLWIGRGSAVETEAELGAAHLLEHMLFKGAGGHGVAEAAARIEGLGGDLNAYTSYEQVVLHATAPAGREEEVIAVLAEMAFAPHLDARELRREKPVVVEEIRAARDDASDRLAEELRARAHGGHVYGRPILGLEETVQALDVRALRRFHRAHYRPAHSLLAVAGPVQADAVEAMARRHLLRWPEALQPLPAPAHGSARPVPGPFLIDDDFEERVVELAWPIPGLAHPDIAALDVLATALGDGDSSILVRVLREEAEVAIDCWATLESEQDRGLFVLGAAARKGAVLDVARLLARELSAATGLAVPEGALRRSRKAILHSRLLDRETVDGRAHRMAWYLGKFGDLQAEALYEAQVQAVGAADLQRVAATWLDPEQVVIGCVAAPSEVEASALAAAVQAGVAEGRARVAAAPTHRAQGPGETPIVRTTLSCGATLVVQPDPRAEMAAVAVVGVGGMLVEGPRQGGLAAAWAQLLTRGAGDLEPRELSALVEARMGSIRAWRARNSVGLDLRFPVDELDLGLSLAGHMLLAPRFDLDELERTRRDLVQAAELLEQDDPGGLAWELAWQGLYPGHAWGRRSLGTPASLARLGRPALQRYHRQVVQGRNLVLAVVGAVDPQEVAASLDRTLARLPPGQACRPAPPDEARLGAGRRRRHSGREQAHLVWAFPGVGHGDAEAATQRLLEGVLSGQSGRLFVEVREERGLAYSVDASAVEGLGGGTLLVAAAVQPERVRQARRAVEGVLASLRDEPVPADELERVKAHVVDGAALGLQRAADRVGHLAAAERYGEGAHTWLQRLQAPREVGAERLQALARRVLDPARCVRVEVGPHVAAGRSAEDEPQGEPDRG